MKVRFAQLTVGQRFTHRGKTFIKLNSLIARDEDNRQQLLPRSTEVEPLDAHGHTTAATPLPEWARVREAFELYHAVCITCIEALADADKLEQAKQTLAEARQRFLATLPE